MEMRFNRNVSGESKGSLSFQKQLAETRRPVAETRRQEKVPDLTDFMNDMFFGAVSNEKKVYNLNGGGRLMEDEDDEDDFDASTRSTNSKLTQEWLEEAKRMMASSPTRCESPSRLVGSPRFAVAQPRLSSASNIDRRDPFSRSARRHRAGEGFSGEILSKSAKHSRNNSEAFDQLPPTADISPASAVHNWFSNILKNPNPNPNPTPPPPSHDPTPPIGIPNPAPPALPPRQSIHRKSRFQNDPNGTQPPGIPIHPSKRTFKTTTTTATTTPAAPLLSPPKHLIESAHRRSISSSTCSSPESQVLSPPRNLVESVHRRSISSSTCSNDRILQKPINGRLMDAETGGRDLNGFLKEQKVQIGKILNGEISGKAKIVLSGPSNSTSSMVAAICHAWLLENRKRTNKDVTEGDGTEVVVPVMNVRRGKMWKQRQAAWLFHHAGIDATALLFSDEVDLERLMMAKQLSILLVGQDILRTNSEVGSKCTILTDNYCEDAYDLLQTPVLKKILLAGILLDTQNLNVAAKLSMTRDAEAVQLLSVGSAPNYGNALYDQLMQDQRESNFFEALRRNYGKPPNESSLDSRAPVEHRTSEKKSYPEAVVQNSDKNSNHVNSARTDNVTPKSAKPLPTQAPAAVPEQAPDAPRGKNKFSIAKWFGFGK